MALGHPTGSMHRGFWGGSEDCRGALGLNEGQSRVLERREFRQFASRILLLLTSSKGGCNCLGPFPAISACDFGARRPTVAVTDNW